MNVFFQRIGVLFYVDGNPHSCYMMCGLDKFYYCVVVLQLIHFRSTYVSLRFEFMTFDHKIIYFTARFLENIIWQEISLLYNSREKYL